MRNELLLATGICLLSAGVAEAQTPEGSASPVQKLIADPASSITVAQLPGGVWDIGGGGGGGSSSVTISGVGTATLSAGYLPVEDVLLDALITGGTLPVSGTITALPSGTQAISAAALPLPTGAATQATLASILSALGSPAQAGATQAVSAASLPLPTGAATSALQSAGNSTLGSIVTALGSPVQAGSTLTIAGSMTLSQIGTVALTNTLPVSGTVALSGGTIALSSGSTVALATGTTVSGTLSSNAGAPVAPGAATATQSELQGCEYVSGGVTFSNGQQGACQVDSAGRLLVDVAAGGSSSTVTLAAGTSNVGTVALATGTTVSGTLNVTPYAYTPANCSAYVVSTGGTAVTAISGPIKGATINNPLSSAGQNIATAEVLYVSMTGAATVTEGGGIFALQPGQPFAVPALATGQSVSVIAATSSHKFSCVAVN